MPLKPPLLYRLVDALGKGVPKFIKKHPALVAGGVGVGYGASQLRKPVHQLEGSIMREYVGAPGAKYSSADLEKFAERKKFLDVKLAFEKVGGKAAMMPPIYINPPPQDINVNMPPKPPQNWTTAFTQGLGGGVGGGIAAEGIGAIRRLLGMTAQSINERLIQDPTRKKIVQTAVSEDPDVKTLEKQQPGSAARAYSTMARYAPELSTDPNVVTAFLRHAAMSGGPVDHTMVKGLAEAETAVQKAKNEGAWLRGGF
jgi:hypothetical protein